MSKRSIPHSFSFPFSLFPPSELPSPPPMLSSFISRKRQAYSYCWKALWILLKSTDWKEFSGLVFVCHWFCWQWSECSNACGIDRTISKPLLLLMPFQEHIRSAALGLWCQCKSLLRFRLMMPVPVPFSVSCCFWTLTVLKMANSTDKKKIFNV